MKLCTVVGARPQFIKAATVSRQISKAGLIVKISQKLTEIFDFAL